MRSRAALRLAALLVVIGAAALPGCAQGAGSKTAFCDQLGKLADPSRIFDTFDQKDRYSNVSRAAAADNVQQVADELRELERDAPRQIKPDVAVLADFTSEVASRVRKYGDDPSELRGKLYDLAQNRLGTASSAVKVNNYAKSECGIDLRRSTSSDGSDTNGSDTNGFDSGTSSDGLFSS